MTSIILFYPFDLEPSLSSVVELAMRKSQMEYNAILDAAEARSRCLSHTECARLLTERGYTEEQAKNGAYVYLHHGESLMSKRRGSAAEYSEILDAFDAKNRPPKECIAHLEQMGFGYRQAQTAVYNYRKARGLVGR